MEFIKQLALKWALSCLLALPLVLVIAEAVQAQGGLRESLEELDADNDGRIDPEEITPLARPYLERIAEARRLSLDRSYRIETLQEAARVYYALKNGVSGRSVRSEVEPTIQPFGAMEDQPLVPEFGLAEVRYPYTQDDLEEADRTIRRNDRDDDGFVDRDEAARGRWTHRNPFEMDLNGDNRLSRLELAQRYARRRLLESDSDELIRRARRVGNGIRSTEQEERGEDSSRWWRRGGSDYWLTASLLSRFDSNRNGRLEATEAQALGIAPGQIDADRNGELSRDELQAHISQLQKMAGDATEGLPGWFYELDTNRDRQVEMSEYTDEWTETKLQEFASLDTNEDGYLTELEVVRSKAITGGAYSNDTADVIPPRKTIISEIEITEDFVVGDLNVRLSITHTNTSSLDAFLTGPDGQRIELFTEVGGSGDHFEETVFDDQSQTPITKARPPFKGSFLPEAVLKRQPSLSHYRGKNAKGVWQLVVRGTRNERFGMLHNWQLIFRPEETMLQAETLPEESAATADRTSAESRESSEPRSKAAYAASDFKGAWTGDKESKVEKKDIWRGETPSVDSLLKLKGVKREDLSEAQLAKYRDWVEAQRGKRESAQERGRDRSYEDRYRSKK